MKGLPCCKIVVNYVICFGYLSRARCKWFAYGPANATATPSSLAPVKSKKVYLSGAGLARLSWKKRLLNGCSSSSSSSVLTNCTFILLYVCVHKVYCIVLSCTCLYQVRLTFLDYINDLAMSLDSDELSNTPCVQQVVMRVIAWASEPKCARIRQVTPLHHHHLLQINSRFSSWT